MRRYEDKPIEEIKFVRYKIVVPTEEDKLELEEAFEHLHYTDCDTEYVAVNQLIHEYLTEERAGYPVKNNIVVDPHAYALLNGGKAKKLHR
jgi:hypothetical protein